MGCLSSKVSLHSKSVIQWKSFQWVILSSVYWPMSHGGLGGSARQPSMETSTDMTYTNPPTFRNTVLVLWLSRNTWSKDWNVTMLTGQDTLVYRGRYSITYTYGLWGTETVINVCLCWALFNRYGMKYRHKGNNLFPTDHSLDHFRNHVTL